MKKKILALLLAATLLFSMLALSGCGVASSGAAGMAEFDVPEVGYDGSEVTIVFYHSMGAKLRGVLDTYIAEFNKLFPNIRRFHNIETYPPEAKGLFKDSAYICHIGCQIGFCRNYCLYLRQQLCIYT